MIVMANVHVSILLEGKKQALDSAAIDDLSVDHVSNTVSRLAFG